jgi:hypothetical protein
MPIPELGGGHEAARVHHANGQCRGVADGGAGAAAGNASDRISQQLIG